MRGRFGLFSALRFRYMLEAWTLAKFSKMMVGLCGRLLRFAEILEHLHHHSIMRASLSGQ